jgi:hypothetical protein
MINISIVQDGKLVPMPNWAISLTEIGRFMDVRRSQNAHLPTVIGVCLPRIDYAALFIGLGILLGARDGPSSHASPEMDRLKKMLGAAVAYQKNERTHLGILESIDEGDNTATIVERNSQKPKIKTNSSFIPEVREQRFTIQVRQCDWAKIHASVTPFDLEKGATKRQTGKAATQHSHNITIASVFSQEVADRIGSSDKPMATAYVEKQRFSEECSGTILGTTAGQILAGDALNTESQREGSGIQVCTASSAIAADCADLLVIEAGRRLGDQLAELGGRKAIVLLARNRAGYKESAANLLSYLAHRGAWAQSIERISIPAYMKLTLIK